ncbi:class I SAM-dependent methyltransferase [Tunturiibacter gelidiferens]|uniref:class I SAM-dependent methyltransferase n=1 Tax=Tunturiibacter gelidiferens TaxID=3069689 RepID=UPI003D9B9A12
MFERLVWQLENEPSLLEPGQLRQRLEALDRLDAYLPDIPQTDFGTGPNDAGLYRRARAICGRLEAVNSELYEAIRCEIQRGERPETLLRWIDSSSVVEEAARPGSGAAGGPGGGMGYDYMDELVSGVFQFEDPGVEDVRREAEMVFYQPTPARHIFSLIGLTALNDTDVLVDLGSGLGHVPLLVSACTRARGIGIELEAAYVERAQQCAQRLNLNMVTFLQQDARAADLSTGTVFYLYTPFVGSILSEVLNRLRREAATRRIRICTYGPCTSVVAEELWLEAAAAPEMDRIVLFRSRG